MQEKDSLRIIGIDPAQLVKWIDEQHMVVVDTRSMDEFIAGFIPESIFLGESAELESTAHMLLPRNEALIIICTPGKEKEIIERIHHAGFEKITGYLQGGLKAWKKQGRETDLIIEVDPDELLMDLPFDEALLLLDVRSDEDFSRSHLKEAEHLPLSRFTDPGALAMIEENDNVYLLSETGFSSTIAASILKKQGLHNVRIISGGWQELRKRVDPSRVSNVDGSTGNSPDAS